MVEEVADVEDRVRGVQEEGKKGPRGFPRVREASGRGPMESQGQLGGVGVGRGQGRDGH